MKYFVGYYRQKIFQSNVILLVLQCWYIGISIFYTITRLGILTMLSLIYSGRYDCLFLADGIDVLRLDSMPLAFIKDILLHEAHRHPYIERLGVMYMMKLRHGNKFCTESGSAWRLIFVFALMPWLRKYRILGTNDLDINELSLISNTRKDDDTHENLSDCCDGIKRPLEKQNESSTESKDVKSDVAEKTQQFQKALEEMDFSKMGSIIDYFTSKDYENEDEAMHGLKAQIEFVTQQNELLKERESFLRLKKGECKKENSISSHDVLFGNSNNSSNREML